MFIVEDDKELPKIGMLLDITNLYAEHTGRLTPWLICMGGVALPLIIYVYVSGWLFLPVWLFVILDILLGIRLLMIFPGRERYRKELFRKKLHSKYKATASMLNINTLHEDGLIEYNNGKVAYIICCFNKTTDDDVQKSIQVRKLLQLILPGRVFDIHILNLNESPALKAYYKKASAFQKTEAAKNFIGIIDHTREVVGQHSNIQCTCFVVFDYKSNWKILRDAMETACASRAARCYKDMYICTDPDTVNEILNRDVNSVINISELTRHKYATGQFDTSKVIAYGITDEDVVIQGQAAIDPVIKDTSSKGFHTTLKEAPNESQ